METIEPSIAAATTTNDELAPFRELPAVDEISNLPQQLQQRESELADLNRQFLSVKSDAVQHRSLLPPPYVTVM